MNLKFTANLAKIKVARSAGLEPATYGLEGCCSIQLSYERTRWDLKVARSIGIEPITLRSEV